MIEVTQLNVYPIKGCRGTALQSMEVDARGPTLDRRFMIVDTSGEFVTQRRVPKLALLEPTWEGGRLTLHAPDMPELSVSGRAEESSQPSMTVRVWRFQGDALRVSEEADAWLSEWLGFSCRLVGGGSDLAREANPEWAPGRTPIGFADGYPILLLSEASLSALNQGILDRDPSAQPMPMARFRPNIVVRGCEPFAEDDWVRIRLGEVELEVVKPCDRCAVTTVDPKTAERGEEPLITLAAMRKSREGVLFGQNCVPRAVGTVGVKQEVQILEAGGIERLPEAWRVSPSQTGPGL